MFVFLLFHQNLNKALAYPCSLVFTFYFCHKYHPFNNLLFGQLLYLIVFVLWILFLYWEIFTHNELLKCQSNSTLFFLYTLVFTKNGVQCSFTEPIYKNKANCIELIWLSNFCLPILLLPLYYVFVQGFLLLEDRRISFHCYKSVFMNKYLLFACEFWNPFGRRRIFGLN